MRNGMLRMLGAAGAAVLLGACQQMGAASRTGQVPDGVSVAVESIEGAPDGVKTALAGALAEAASERRVDLVGAGAQARYRVRGYLATEESADGAVSLTFVFDVFDGEQRRGTRVAGAKPIKSASARDPWSALDDEALSRLAEESLDGIAGFLVASAERAASSSGEVEGAALGFTAQ